MVAGRGGPAGPRQKKVEGLISDLQQVPRLQGLGLGLRGEECVVYADAVLAQHHQVEALVCKVVDNLAMLATDVHGLEFEVGVWA